MARLDVVAERLTDESMQRHHGAAMVRWTETTRGHGAHLAAWRAVSGNFDEDDED